MDHKGAELIITTLGDYSAEAVSVLEYLQKYDYRNEAAEWETLRQPALLEAEHPTLYGLYIRLVRYMSAIPHRTDNLDRAALLQKDNFLTFCNYLQVSQETLLAARFDCIPIEPMLSVATAFKGLGLNAESGLLQRVYDFAYSVRKWYQASKRNPGTPIELKLEINYEEASPEDLAADEGYTTFASLFKPSCNYSTKQKRALYNALKDARGNGHCQRHPSHLGNLADGEEYGAAKKRSGAEDIGKVVGGSATPDGAEDQLADAGSEKQPPRAVPEQRLEVLADGRGLGIGRRLHPFPCQGEAADKQHGAKPGDDGNDTGPLPGGSITNASGRNAPLEEPEDAHSDEASHIGKEHPER